MKATYLSIAVLTALTSPFAASAADAPAKDVPAKETTTPVEKTTKAEPAKKKVKPHSHVEAKGGMAMSEPTEAKEQPKRPPHDHLKEK